MANQKQLKVLRQGVDIWNKWRMENPTVKIDLSQAILNEADLSKAYLQKADLNGANLFRADLSNANLVGADLRDSDCSDADLHRAMLMDTDLRGAKINGADLGSADLREANLSKASLSGVDFRKADLRWADLSWTNLAGSKLIESIFIRTRVGFTIFGNSDLSNILGLAHTVHVGPSSISTDAFALSKGKISDTFLRGCGLSDWEIESVKLYNPNLRNDEFIDIQNRIFDLRNRHVLQVSSLFISYSHSDSMFVDKLESYLNSKGIRFWRDVHEATSGRLEKQIDRAMRLNPTVLLILSQHSIKSDWVEHEVRTARGLEKEMERDVLCPIALDSSWKKSPWPKRVMEQVMEYNILDFSAWEDDSKFESTFNKLIDGLGLFYNG